MPPSAHKPEDVTIDKPSVPQEYYPQFSKQKFEYHQLNGTSVNFTMDLEPPLQHVNTLYMTILDHERQMIDEIPRRLFYPENYYIIDGLYEGNFTLWIRPIDQFSNDRSKCVCYKGTNGTRHMCIPCHDIETHIHVRHVKIPVPEDGTYSIRVLVGTVTGAVLTLVVILTTVFLLCRRRELPCSFIGTFTRRRKSFQVVTCPKLKIFCVFASDNPAHVKAVSAFLELVQLCRGFEIIHFDSSPSPLSSCESLFSGGFRYETVLEQADIIVVVRSAWANALLEDMELKTVYPSDAPSDDDCKFISCMHQIKQNSLYCSKTVSVLFKYSQEDTSLIGNLTGPVYSVPNDLQSFISYLYSKSEISCRVLTQSFDQERDRLVQAINMCSAYQLQNRNWLAKKMFLLKTYLSRADSGIVTQRRRTNFSISIRSRSADTVSSSRYRPECHTGQSRGRACCHNQLKRTRTLSCDFSFSAPESEKEDQSMRFSMLENKFVAINERYEYILNYKLKTEDDCYTIDGKSV